jgi:hypothetical protein
MHVDITNFETFLSSVLPSAGKAYEHGAFHKCTAFKIGAIFITVTDIF